MEKMSRETNRNISHASDENQNMSFFFLNGHSVFVKNTVLEDLSYLWTWAESSTQVQLSSALEVQASLMKPPWRRKG